MQVELFYSATERLILLLINNFVLFLFCIFCYICLFCLIFLVVY